MKRLLSLFVAFALVLACTPVIPFQANAAVVASGTCGDNLTWKLETPGVLTISGTGSMTNYSSSYGSVPWYDYRSVIKSVIIEDGVTSIGEDAFAHYYYSLESIMIADSVESIGSSAFYDCSSLTSVYITDLAAWRKISFGNDRADPLYYGGGLHILDEKGNEINEIILDESMTEIPAYWFEDCKGITSIVIPDSVTSIGNSAFNYCISLTGIWVGENNPNYSSDSCGVLFNKDKTTLIQAPGAISGSYVIPDSVTSIGDYAFHYCSSLTSVVIPDGVTSIGDYAFHYCSSLTSVVIPDGVTSIGNYAFFSCDSLTSIEIPDSVTSIGERAFYYCTSLTSIEIPDSVTSIGSYAFSYCSSLTSIVIPDSVTSIGYSAFSGCGSLESITIPFVGGSKKTASDTEQYPFGYIFGDLSYTGGVATSQTYNAWYNGFVGHFSTKSTTYYIPSSLKSVTVTGGEILYGAFDRCANLTSVIIGNGVTGIGSYAFSSCSSLTSVVIPDGVTSIGSYAFSSCSSLTSVVIPESVYMIGSDAFWLCSSLTDVYYGGTYAQWNEIMVASGNDYLTNATIHTAESEPVLIGIGLKEKPVKTEYVLGEALDITGIVLTGSYSNSSTAEITEGFTVSGFDSATVGTKTVTVTYEGYTTTFTVTVDDPMVCQHLETGDKYKTLEEALAAATGGTIKLLTDSTAGNLIVNPNVTLDLNGYTLTADFVIVANGATILDGGADCTGGGLLKVAEMNLGFIRENGQGIIPVWNGEDGYVFTKVTFQQMARKGAEGAAQYIFLPTFTNSQAAALMADGGTDNGVTIKVCMTWANGQSQQYYTYSDNFVAQVFDGTNQYAFDLSVTGIAGITDMVASPVVVTDTYAQATTTGTTLVAG